MKRITLLLFLFLLCSTKEGIASNSLYDPQEHTTKLDSGFLSTLQKGYEIASKLTIDDVGKIATIVLFNNNKKLNYIVKDVSDYVNQVSKAQKDLRKIKINKNTRVMVKRDK
jgi:hypothetical protein